MFWVDVSIIDYNLFGDAITFDTTYNTNKYKLEFGMFNIKRGKGMFHLFISRFFELHRQSVKDNNYRPRPRYGDCNTHCVPEHILMLLQVAHHAKFREKIGNVY